VKFSNLQTSNALLFIGGVGEGAGLDIKLRFHIVVSHESVQFVLLLWFSSCESGFSARRYLYSQAGTPRRTPPQLTFSR
jgi:hypothetical protein